MRVVAQGPTFVSLYSGAGGLDIGFMEAGFTPVFAVDMDPLAAETYNYSYKRLQDRLPNLAGHNHGCRAGHVEDHMNSLEALTTDLVVGGPPCQGFSVAGKMDPADPRSQHVWRFLDVVALLTPSAFVMENVKALAVSRRWTGLRDGLRARAMQLGYNTYVRVLNASHYGVPQARERMFLIGLREGKEFSWPSATTHEKPPTVRSALSELPPWGASGNERLCNAIVTPARRPVLRRSPFAGMLFNGTGRPMRLDEPAPTLYASMGGNRTPIVDQEHLEGRDGCWVTLYHSHLMEGGEPYTVLPERLRRITLEEAARIQGFPVDMEWRGKQSSIYRQIGNAVPPPLARAVAESVRAAS